MFVNWIHEKCKNVVLVKPVYSGELGTAKRILSHNMFSCRSSSAWFLPDFATAQHPARLLHRTLHSILHSTLHSTIARLRHRTLHPAQHPAQHHCQTSPPHSASCTAPCTAPVPDFATVLCTASCTSPCTAPLPDFATALCTASCTAPCAAPLPDFATAHCTASCTAPLRKIDARSYEVLHLSRKIILANLQIWCSKMQPLSGNQRPDLLTSLMNMSFVLCLPRKMHLCRSSSNVPRLPWFLEMRQKPHVLLTFDKVHNPLRLPRETTSEPPKVARACGALYILTSKCASRHNGVHFFDIATSKSGPTLVCFVHFDFGRALFRHRNSQLPKVVRTWGVFSFFTY